MYFQTASTLFLALSVVSAVPHHHRSTTCYEDNTLRALERFSSEASAMCPKYLASDGAAVPSDLAEFKGYRLSSACSCYEKTAGGGSPATTATPTTSPAAPVVPVTTPTTAPTTIASTPTTSPTTTSTPAVLPTTMKAQAPVQSSTTATMPSTPETNTSSSASTSPTGVTTGGTAKRGLVYDYNSKSAYADFFVGSPYVSFGSNWGATRATGNGITIPNSFAFVPTLTVDGNLSNDNWLSTAKAAIQSGSKYIFASNEPDNAGQANLSPEDAATVYKKYMQPLQGQALLATPAVTNGGGQTGLGYLGEFLGNCTECHFDMINIHHYVQRSDFDVDGAVNALKDYIETNVPALQAQHTSIQNLPIMVGEFWLWNASPTEGGTYLQEIMPYLDGNKNIIGYQAFGGLWTNNFITSDGTGLTPAGTTYKSYYKAE